MAATNRAVFPADERLTITLLHIYNIFYSAAGCRRGKVRANFVVPPRLISNKYYLIFWYHRILIRCHVFIIPFQSIVPYLRVLKNGKFVFLFRPYVAISFHNTVRLCDMYLNELVNKHFKNTHIFRRPDMHHFISLLHQTIAPALQRH